LLVGARKDNGLPSWPPVENNTKK